MLSRTQWGLCALRHGIHNSMGAVCITSWYPQLNGGCVHYVMLSRTQWVLCALRHGIHNSMGAVCITSAEVRSDSACAVSKQFLRYQGRPNAAAGLHPLGCCLSLLALPWSRPVPNSCSKRLSDGQHPAIATACAAGFHIWPRRSRDRQRHDHERGWVRIRVDRGAMVFCSENTRKPG